MTRDDEPSHAPTGCSLATTAPAIADRLQERAVRRYLSAVRAEMDPS